MKIDSSLPVYYEQGSVPALGEGYENRSVDIGKSQGGKNVLVPVPPQLPDDIVDINGWSAKKAGKQPQEEKGAEGKLPVLTSLPADAELQNRPAKDSTRAMTVYVMQQYRNQQAGSSMAIPGGSDYPKGSMIDVWA
jgi:hypothetical protein